MVYNARAPGENFLAATEVVFKTALVTEGPKETKSKWGT